MQKINKVIRIPMNSEMFYDLIESRIYQHSANEIWLDYEALYFEYPKINAYTDTYDPDIIKQLRDKEADYLAIYKED